MFEFLDYECITDGEITLLLYEKAPADEEKGYVPAYKYTIVKNGYPAGKCDIRIGDNDNTWYGGHIGYEVFPEFRGHNLAAKACRLLKQVAAAHGMTRVYISCNPENTASRRTAESLGARLVDTVDLPENHEMYLLGEREKRIYEWHIDSNSDR
jgi:predicted acetyltransferase